MKFVDLLALASREPVFASSLLLTRDVDPADLRRQLCRWVQAGKLLQLRRGLYALAEPYRKLEPAPFLVANRLHAPSYVSLQSALAHHGLIPEHVPAVTSVTTTRPEELTTPLGRFIYRHLTPSRFFGFRELALGLGQTALVAAPEKALLDLVHLTPGGDGEGFLAELRLQNLEELDLDLLNTLAHQSGSPKLRRAARRVAALAAREEYQTL